jgi:ribonuclease VapC
MNNLVLDSYAMIAYLENESCADKVEKELEDADSGRSIIWLSLVNWGEVYYSVYRSKGQQSAAKCIEVVDQLPIKLVDCDRTITKKAALLKAKYPIAYGDCFAAALAQIKNCPILTGDPEFKLLHKEIKVSWL